MSFVIIIFYLFIGLLFSFIFYAKLCKDYKTLKSGGWAGDFNKYKAINASYVFDVYAMVPLWPIVITYFFLKFIYLKCLSLIEKIFKIN